MHRIIIINAKQLHEMGDILDLFVFVTCFLKVFFI
jgi:hypothetical protein